jgi:hypothetical protein
MHQSRAVTCESRGRSGSLGPRGGAVQPRRRRLGSRDRRVHLPHCR